MTFITLAIPDQIRQPIPKPQIIPVTSLRALLDIIFKNACNDQSMSIILIHATA